MEEFQARGTYNMQADLLGSFPVDVSPGTSGRFGWGHRTKFSPSVGGRGGHRNMGVAIGRIYPFRGWGSFWQKNSCQIFYTSNPNRHPQLYFSKQHFPSLDISLVPNSHPATNWPEEHIFFQKQIYSVPLMHVMAVKNSGARAGFLIYSYFKDSVFTAIIFPFSRLFLFFLRESFVT